jgi:DNA primase large subunit
MAEMEHKRKIYNLKILHCNTSILNMSINIRTEQIQHIYQELSQHMMYPYNPCERWEDKIKLCLVNITLVCITP